mgnify:CR=1 FL=1
MDFSATQLSTEEFTPEQIQIILANARLQIDDEELVSASKMKMFFFFFFLIKNNQCKYEH